MVGCDQSLAVTANRGVVGGGSVQDVRAVDFLGLGEALHQAEVRWLELGLVQVVVNSFTSDRIAEADFCMLLVVDVTLTSIVVESSLTAFGFQLSVAEEAHFSGAFQSHFRVVLGEDFVVLCRNLLVLAFNSTEAGEQKVFDGT